MGGLFGVASRGDCVQDIFYGTDYHSHLGTYRGGLVCINSVGFKRFIHDITNSQFRSKFEDDVEKMHGHTGIGVISDTDDQPLIIGSHLGTFAIATVGRINNLDQLASDLFRKGSHFSEMAGDTINPTEMVAKLICQGETFVDGDPAGAGSDRGFLHHALAHEG
jgi:amidophosphoribosyltransferase